MHQGQIPILELQKGLCNDDALMMKSQFPYGPWDIKDARTVGCLLQTLNSVVQRQESHVPQGTELEA